MIKKEGYEFENFKITFSITIVAYLNKILMLQEAEDKFGRRFPFAQKDIQRSSIDFKEVYKWIMSPLISKALNVPANLDGKFLVNVNFCKRESQMEGDSTMEQRIIEGI